MSSLVSSVRSALSIRPRSRPRTVLFEVTQRCNLDCMYCYNVWKGDAQYPAGELPTEETRALLRKVLRETPCR